MRIIFLSILLNTSLNSLSVAQYEAGDIALVRYNTDTNDGFSFLVLVSIASGDSIFFTDEGWDDTAGTTGWRNSSEEHLKYISPGLNAGDVVHIEETSGDVFTVSGSGGTVSLRRGSGFSLISGDQILAYTGSEVRPDSPNFLAALHGDDGGDTTTGSNDPDTKWTRDGEVAGTQQSALPDRLINGVSAISVFGDSESEVDNMIYNCSITSGTKSEILIAVNNRANWTTDDTNNQPFASVCTFIVNSSSSTIISGSAGWRLLSIPKTLASVSDISDDTAVQGINGGNDAASNSNFRLYDNSADFSEKPTDINSSWGDGLGFALYFFDNKVNGSSSLPIALDVTGSEPSSDVEVSLNSNAGGFTLVGNPFASNYSTSSILATPSNISNNIAFWDDGANSYSIFDRTLPFIISPWQGFWVQTINTEATELTFPISGKSSNTTTGTYFSKEANEKGDINFTLSSDSTYDNAIRLSFRKDATYENDEDDFGKLLPLTSSFAIMAFKSNDILKSVESLPWDLQEEVTIRMETQLVGVSGGFTLEWKGLESIPVQWELTFHDYETEAYVDMRIDSLYTFDAKAPATKVNPKYALTNPLAKAKKSKSAGTRFAITISPTSSVSNKLDDKASKFALDQNYPNPFNPTTTINYSVENAGEVNISIYNLMGQKVAELVNGTKAAGSYNVTWNASGVSSGMYYYRLEAGGQSITRKMTLIK